MYHVVGCLHLVLHVGAWTYLALAAHLAARARVSGALASKNAPRCILASSSLSLYIYDAKDRRTSEKDRTTGQRESIAVAE